MVEVIGIAVTGTIGAMFVLYSTKKIGGFGGSCGSHLDTQIHVWTVLVEELQFYTCFYRQRGIVCFQRSDPERI